MDTLCTSPLGPIIGKMHVIIRPREIYKVGTLSSLAYCDYRSREMGCLAMFANMWSNRWYFPERSRNRPSHVHFCSLRSVWCYSGWQKERLYSIRKSETEYFQAINLFQPLGIGQVMAQCRTELQQLWTNSAQGPGVDSNHTCQITYCYRSSAFTNHQLGWVC